MRRHAVKHAFRGGGRAWQQGVPAPSAAAAHARDAAAHAHHHVHREDDGGQAAYSKQGKEEGGKHVSQAQPLDKGGGWSSEALGSQSAAKEACPFTAESSWPGGTAAHSSGGGRTQAEWAVP